MDKYVCAICGHEYDPSKGEPAQDIQSGIAFDQLPSDWQCPVCSAEKRLFTKV